MRLISPLLFLLLCLGLSAPGCTIKSADSDDGDSSLDEGDPGPDPDSQGDGDSGDGDGDGDGDSAPAGDGDGDGGDGDAADPEPTEARAPIMGSSVKGQVPTGTPDATDVVGAGREQLATETAQAGDAGDDAWLISQDLDGDGTDDDGVVVYDDETETLYVEYETYIVGWCIDGSDTFSDVLEVYYPQGGATDVVLWDSDCPEDAGIVFGCELDEDGVATDVCGSCSRDGDNVWHCMAISSDEPPNEPPPPPPGRCDVGDESDLADADLHDCDLSSLDLSGVDLSGADLEGADLTDAKLGGADLRGAFLVDTNLTGADLTDAQLGGALFANTTCPDGTNSDDNDSSCDGHL